MLDIYASVFHPIRADDRFLIVASAIPCEHGQPMPHTLGKSATASTFEEARRLCSELAASLQSMLQQRGEKVRDVHVKDGA